METVVMIALAVVVAGGFFALWLWTRRSEATISYDKPGLSDEQANATRFGIAMTVNQSNVGL